MPRISEVKIKKIEEQILFFLYNTFPNQSFTAHIAVELARDEEFIKKMLLEMEKKNLVVKITQNKEGIVYQRRLRWRISNKVHQTYQNLQ